MIADEPATASLTPRERQLVGLLMQGMTSTPTLADAMTLSEHTVRYHVAEVLRKLNVSNRAQIVAFAWRHGTCRGGHWSPTR